MTGLSMGWVWWAKEREGSTRKASCPAGTRGWLVTPSAEVRGREGGWHGSEEEPQDLALASLSCSGDSGVEIADYRRRCGWAFRREAGQGWRPTLDIVSMRMGRVGPKAMERTSPPRDREEKRVQAELQGSPAQH